MIDPLLTIRNEIETINKICETLKSEINKHNEFLEKESLKLQALKDMEQKLLIPLNQEIEEKLSYKKHGKIK